MSTETKSIWTKFVEQPRRFFLTLAGVSLAGLLICLLLGLLLKHSGPSPTLRAVAAFTVAILVATFVTGFFGFFLCLIAPLQPLFRWTVRKSVLLFASAVTLVALLYAQENWRGNRAWKRVEREASERGISFNMKDIVPAPVPKEQNVTATPLFQPMCNEFDGEWRKMHSGPNGITNEADRLKFKLRHQGGPQPEDAFADRGLKKFTDLKTWQEYFRSAPANPNANGQISSDAFPVTPQPQSPAEDVLLALSKYDAVVEELREAVNRPHAIFPVRYEDGFAVLLPHLARFKGINQFFELRIAAELETGKINEAAADQALAFRLADLVREEPLLISQLVRLAQTQLALNSLWEGLAQHRWTEAQLAGFDAQLARIDFLEAYHHGMRGERAASIWTLDYLRRERDFEFVDGNLSDGSGLARILAHLIPRGWFEQNKASLARMHLDLILPAVDVKSRTVSPSKVKDLTKEVESLVSHRSPYNLFAHLLIPALLPASGRFAQGQASVDLARVACALERHRLATGQYPETLDALSPKFLSKLPHDVVNGQPFKYRRTAEGSFVLYSVGWNETDDGGTIVEDKKQNRTVWDEGDWVWHYPSEKKS